jgi:multicomponent Na+:H+ antiporter subunit G
MIDIIIGLLCTIGALAILVAAIGILRMPDFYLRLSVTVKAATLGGGLLLLSAAFYFPEEVSVTTKALAIIFFLILTAPVAAHLIARSAYFIGTTQWKGTVRDDLAGMYDKETHQLGSSKNEEKVEPESGANDSAV